MKRFQILVMIFALWAGVGSAADFQALLQEWQRVDPQGYAQHKPDIDKLQKEQEKDLKDAADKAFEHQFKSVFGDHLKPSEAYDFMKVVEAASAGDFQFMAKEGGKMFVAKFLPKLNMYVTVLENTAKLIRATEQVWVNELYVSDAYLNAVSIIGDAERDRDAPYVPSYLIKFDHADPRNAEIMQIFQQMRTCESQMFQAWKSKDLAHSEAVRILMGPNWAARFRSALKKDPTERQIFNHFLHRITSGNRARYAEVLKDRYIYPLAKQQAREGKRTFSVAMARGVKAAVLAMTESHTPIRGIFLNHRIEDPSRPSGVLCSFGFQGAPNTTYRALLARGLDKSLDEKRAINARTDASGKYQGEHIYKTFQKTGNWQIVFVVKDTDGKVHRAVRVLAMKRYTPPAKSDAEWSQSVGPHIQELMVKANAKFEWNIKRQGEINNGINEVYATTEEYIKRLHSIVDMQNRDEQSLTPEQLNKKYSEDGRVSQEYNRLRKMVEQNKKQMEEMEDSKIPFAKEAYVWLQFKRKIKSTYDENSLAKALQILIADPCTGKLGMTGKLQSDLNKIEADRERAAGAGE